MAAINLGGSIGILDQGKVCVLIRVGIGQAGYASGVTRVAWVDIQSTAADTAETSCFCEGDDLGCQLLKNKV